MRTGALITAAGLSSRMGSFKPLLPLGDDTLLRRGLHTLRSAGAGPIAVVTGREAARLEESLRGLPVTCLYNSNYASCQMLDSIKLGLAWLEGKCDQVLFTPGDVPLYSQETVAALARCNLPLCCPVCGGKRGHPVLISAALIPAILSYEGEGGLAGAMTACGGAAELETGDPGILLDADTPEQYQTLLSYARQTGLC